MYQMTEVDTEDIGTFFSSIDDPLKIPTEAWQVAEKLRVSWAEDVCDPPPSIVSHTRSKKQQHHKSKSRDSLKKNGKKGHKGSSSSSSSRGSKDKKSSSRSKHNRDKFGWATQMPPIAAASS
ncbi:hypothetical protein Bca52824_000255 [Brassica carinata]|uniref:Uncharacterized protein n=1 Tax=Brassica carinata TaxID=52824 RepID=A0A8X7WH20_BRACI|nr:hypothetical protein Bca52824_000255 [Brassica carinata]